MKYDNERSYLIPVDIHFKRKKHNKNISILKLMVFCNLILLSINAYYLLKNEKEKIVFKNTDLFFLKKVINSYQQLSRYFNDKYINMNNNIKSEEKREKKKITIYFVDLYNRNFREKWIKEALGDIFNIEFDSEKPDYIFFNIFGCEHLNPKYKDSIKIAHFTENKIVNFNEADYAIGQHHINYLDRYYRRPFFIFQLFNNTNENFNKIRKKVLDNPKRTEFCAAVISNTGWTDGFRRLFYKELNKYKTIGMGGRYHNNVGGRVRNKISFLSKYKFSLAMENTKSDGYITEKIIDAFLAGNIPIYYGDYMVEEYINPKSFILIKGKKDMMEKIEYIKKIDNDDELYRSILKETVLINNNISYQSTNERIQFLAHIFEQNKTLAKRIDNYHWK